MANQDAASVNSPDITPAGTIKKRAIENADQAGKIAKQLENDSNSKERNIKNARIMAKYNSEKPWNNKDLEQDGLSWKSNFSTKPLAILIDKVSPRFTTAIQTAKFLTSASLPETVEGSAKKTEVFRDKITKTVRARRGWKNLIGEIAQENALFGYTSAAWTDEYTWFPTHYRQDKFFVSEGTKQDVETAQIIVLKDDMPLHLLFAMIEDVEAARSAGWNIENVVEALNKAMPADRRSGMSNNARILEDLIREMSVATSMATGAKTVPVYHVFVREVTGSVSSFIVGGEKYVEFFTRFDRFPSMSEACTFFSFQQGNGTMHGSKGIGREIYNMASVLDRSRNEVVDRLQLSGKIIVKCDEKLINRFRMSVIGNAILIGSNYNIEQQKIEPEAEPFFELDNYLVSLLDQIAGSTTPKQLEGERVTKAQVDLFAGREEEKRDAIIERFLNQFADMMSTIQKRICNPQTVEEDAKQLQAELLQHMTREELDYLANQPAAGTVADFTELERQQVVLICQEARGNPLYNQKEIERRKLTATVGAEFADAVLLPDEDPTVVAENTRTQMFENDLLMNGQEVPVSPRDNAATHLQTLLPVIQSTAQEMIQNDAAIQIMLSLLAHAEAHIQTALQGGTNPKELEQFVQVVEEAKKAVADVQAQQQEQIDNPPMPVATAPPQEEEMPLA